MPVLSVVMTDQALFGKNAFDVDEADLRRRLQLIHGYNGLGSDMGQIVPVGTRPARRPDPGSMRGCLPWRPSAIHGRSEYRCRTAGLEVEWSDIHPTGIDDARSLARPHPPIDWED